MQDSCSLNIYRLTESSLTGSLGVSHELYSRCNAATDKVILELLQVVEQSLKFIIKRLLHTIVVEFEVVPEHPVVTFQIFGTTDTGREGAAILKDVGADTDIAFFSSVSISGIREELVSAALVVDQITDTTRVRIILYFHAAVDIGARCHFSNVGQVYLVVICIEPSVVGIVIITSPVISVVISLQSLITGIRLNTIEGVYLDGIFALGKALELTIDVEGTCIPHLSCAVIGLEVTGLAFVHPHGVLSGIAIGEGDLAGAPCITHVLEERSDVETFLERLASLDSIIEASIAEVIAALVSVRSS